MAPVSEIVAVISIKDKCNHDSIIALRTRRHEADDDAFDEIRCQSIASAIEQNSGPGTQAGHAVGRGGEICDGTLIDNTLVGLPLDKQNAPRWKETRG